VSTRYFRQDFDVELVWRSTDGDVDDAQFVWDSASQIATGQLLDDAVGSAGYQMEVGDEDRYEVTDADEIAALEEALGMRLCEYQKDPKDAEIVSLRERLERAEASAQEWQGASILNASALKLAAEERDAAEALVAEFAAVARAADDYLTRMRDCLTREDITLDDEEARDVAEGVAIAALAGLSDAARAKLEEVPDGRA
jgi:hypothetical protein